jgi:alpha-galactosidase
MNRKNVLLAVSASALLLYASGGYALNNGCLRTPQMGFNTWNYFACGSHGAINETLIKSLADAFTSGSPSLASVGYQFVNVDDCWANSSRNSQGGLVCNTNFPSGMKAVASYVHGKGLKLGLYTDVALKTCAQTMPGMSGHEQQDADTFQAWGIDYIKVDWCSGTGDPKVAYTKVRDVLHNSVTRVSGGKEIVFSICNWGNGNPWTWGAETGNSWRTTGDINTGNIWSLLESNVNLYSYAGPGAWNDPDMLEVGNGNNAQSDSSHFAIWCMLAAPLLCGNDIRNMSATTRGILTAPEVIAVNQDSLGKQAQRVSNNGYQIWVKLLKAATNSEYAVAFFNKNNSALQGVTRTQMATVGGDIGASTKSYTVRNLWTKTNLGTTWTPSTQATWTPPAAIGNMATAIFRFSAVSTDVLSPIATVRVTETVVRPENERVVVHTAKPGPFSITMVNLKGALVCATNGVGAQVCDISTRGLNRGIYFVNVQAGKERITRKVILK